MYFKIKREAHTLHRIKKKSYVYRLSVCIPVRYWAFSMPPTLASPCHWIQMSKCCQQFSCRFAWAATVKGRKLEKTKRKELLHKLKLSQLVFLLNLWNHHLLSPDLRTFSFHVWQTEILKSPTWAMKTLQTGITS